MNPKISATALEETKILVWHRDKLKLILTMSDPFLKTVLDHVVARDVVKKLTQVRRQLTHFFASELREMALNVGSIKNANLVNELHHKIFGEAKELARPDIFRRKLT